MSHRRCSGIDRVLFTTRFSFRYQAQPLCRVGQHSFTLIGLCQHPNFYRSVRSWRDRRPQRCGVLPALGALIPPAILPKINPIKPRVHLHRETRCISRQANARRIKPKLQQRTTILNCFMLTMCLRVRIFLTIATLHEFEDNEAVIKIVIKGRSPTMRHVSRTHRVALDWLFDRINLDPKIQILYIDTKHQHADILTKGSFTRDEWNSLFICLTSAISALSLLC